MDKPAPAKIQLGPLTIGGAIRANYILGSYPGGGSGPSRGGNGGNFELDTFRINMALDDEQLVGELEYRWYNGYNFIHTGWLGYKLDDASQIQAGVSASRSVPVPTGSPRAGSSTSTTTSDCRTTWIWASSTSPKGKLGLAFAYL